MTTVPGDHDVGRALAAAVALAILATASAAASTVSVEVELHVPVIQFLVTTPGMLDIPSPTPIDLERGTLDVPERVVLVVSSNVPWDLFVRRANPSDPTESAHSATVQGRLDGDPFTTIGSSWRPLATGEPVDREALSFWMRLVVSWSTSPGEHEPRLEYRLAPREI
jgi:hypothetical protein